MNVQGKDSSRSRSTICASGFHYLSFLAAWAERYEKAKQKFNARNNPYEGLSADQLKTHGNQKMVSGQYQEAVNYYGKAIEIDGTSSIYYANRAAVQAGHC